MYDNIEKGQFGFPMMAQILPEMEHGEAKLVHHVITEEALSFARLRAAISGDWTSRGLRAGTYAVLKVKGQGTVMSDTWIERHTNLEIVKQAKGNVLIGGLGLGLILTVILDKPEVESVTVLEKSADVISMIAPYFQHPKLTVIQADVFTWKPTHKYQCIYMDIWPEINVDNCDDIAKLNRKYSPWVDRTNGHFIGCWMQDTLRSLKRQGRWR